MAYLGGTFHATFWQPKTDLPQRTTESLKAILPRNLYYGWRPQSYCCWGKIRTSEFGFMAHKVVVYSSLQAMPQFARPPMFSSQFHFSNSTGVAALRQRRHLLNMCLWKGDIPSTCLEIQETILMTVLSWIKLLFSNCIMNIFTRLKISKRLNFVYVCGLRRHDRPNVTQCPEMRKTLWWYHIHYIQGAQWTLLDFKMTIITVQNWYPYEVYSLY